MATATALEGTDMNRTAIRRALLPGLVAAGALLIAGCSGTPVRNGTADTAPATRGPTETGDPLRQRVVRSALQALGTPYRYGGNGPQQGFDCSGLVQYSHAAAGIRVPRVTAQQRRHARPVPLAKLRPGDLLFFEIDGKGRHVGIYVGNGEFIHAPSSGKRVSRARLDMPYWRNRLVASGSYL
jgi:cell wall-associated NlpC family hydrolase